MFESNNNSVTKLLQKTIFLYSSTFQLRNYMAMRTFQVTVKILVNETSKCLTKWKSTLSATSLIPTKVLTFIGSERGRSQCGDKVDFESNKKEMY